MSARRPHWPPAVPASLAAALVVLLTAVVGTPADAATGRVVLAATRATPSPTPTGTTGPDDDADATDTRDEVAPAVEVEVTEVSPQVLRPGDELLVRARVRNSGDTELRVPRVTLRISRFLQSTRSSLEQWSSLDLDETAGSPVLPVSLDGPLAPDAAVDVELRVPASALRLSTADTAWGPRGISVEVTDGGRREGIQRTFVLWMPTEQALTRTQVSVLVPLTGGTVDPTAVPTVGDEASVGEDDAGTPATPDAAGADTATTGTATPSAGPEAGATSDATAGPPATPTPATDAPTETPADTPADTPAVLGGLTADVLSRLDDVVDATRGQAGVSWAVDPALLAAARSPGAGAAAARWAVDVTAAAAGRDVFTLPSRDPDLAALAHGDGDTLGALAGTAAAAATDPALGSPVRTDLAWPATDVPDVATVALAARLGATSVVVGDEGLVPEELTYTPTGRATVETPDGPVAALVADEVLSEELAAPRDTTPAAAAQRVLAETAVITRERPTEQRHVLLTADRGWEPDVPVATAQVTALASAPWVALTPLSTLIGSVDPDVERDPLPDRRVDDGELSPAAIGSLLRAHTDLAAFSTVVPDPAELAAGADDAVVAPTAVAWRADPDRRAAVVDAVVTDLDARRSGVSIVPGSSLVLLSETGRFPLGLRNELDQDATVQVSVDPTSARLVVDGTERIVIPAGSESQARIPFHAVGSGDVVVQVSLLTPDGVPLGPAQRFTVRVRADWENVGTAVVAGALALALVVGIIRTVRRGQTARRGAGSTPVTEIAALPRDEP